MHYGKVPEQEERSRSGGGEPERVLLTYNIE